MANGTTHDRTAARIEELERRFEDRATRRDQAEAEMREILADLAARVQAAEKAAEKSPSWLAFVVAGATIAGLLGALGQYAIRSEVVPVKGDVEETRADIHDWRGNITGYLKDIQDRQDNVRQRVANIEGRLTEIDKRVDDVDKFGSRRGNQGEKR